MIYFGYGYGVIGIVVVEDVFYFVLDDVNDWNEVWIGVIMDDRC